MEHRESAGREGTPPAERAERRDWPRRQAAFDVGEPGGPLRACHGDLSVGGLGFVTATPPAGDALELSVTLPTYSGPLTAKGQVTSRRGHEKGTAVGVAFTELDLDAELAIAQWFDEQLLEVGADLMQAPGPASED